MAFLIDLTDSNGNVTKDVYARLARTQNALSLRVNVFSAGEPITPAGSPRSAQIADRDCVTIDRQGTLQIIYKLAGTTIGGDLIPLAAGEHLDTALDTAAGGDTSETLAALYRAARHRLLTDPALTAKIGNVRDV